MCTTRLLPHLRTHRNDTHCQRIAQALLQQTGQPVPLEDQVVVLFALQQGYADAVAPEEAAAWMARAVQWVRQVSSRARMCVAVRVCSTLAVHACVCRFWQES